MTMQGTVVSRTPVRVDGDLAELDARHDTAAAHASGRRRVGARAHAGVTSGAHTVGLTAVSDELMVDRLLAQISPVHPGLGHLPGTVVHERLSRRIAAIAAGIR
jgi:hypothetical protein